MPSGVQMQTMRRIGPRLAPGRAKAGASSQGSASETPAARRKRRRSILMASPSLGPEQAALDDFMDQCPEAVILPPDLPDDRVDLRLIGRRRRPAGRIGGEPRGQGPRDLVLVAKEQRLE